MPRYDRTMIRGIVIAAYLGWITFGAVSILLPSPLPSTPTTSSALPIHLASTSVCAAFWALFAKQRSPGTFYVYILFPCYFWDQALVRAGRPLLQYVRQGQPGSVAWPIVRGVLVIAALQSMVVGVYFLNSCDMAQVRVRRPHTVTARFGARGSSRLASCGPLSRGRVRLGRKIRSY